MGKTCTSAQKQHGTCMVWFQPLYSNGLKFPDFTCWNRIGQNKRKPMSSMTKLKTEVLEIDSIPFQAAYRPQSIQQLRLTKTAFQVQSYLH